MKSLLRFLNSLFQSNFTIKRLGNPKIIFVTLKTMKIFIRNSNLESYNNMTEKVESFTCSLLKLFLKFETPSS